MVARRTANNGGTKEKDTEAKGMAAKGKDMEVGTIQATNTAKDGKEQEKAKEVHTEEEKETSMAKAKEAREEAQKVDVGSAKVTTMLTNAQKAMEKAAKDMGTAKERVESTAWRNRGASSRQ
jgi:hypothetical protein